MDEYDLLVKNGNIGIYNCCEVTELVIIEADKIYNLYTICVFQERNVNPEKYQCDKWFCNNIEIDDKHSIGIIQYELELSEIKENFEKLINEYRWISNHKDESSINYNDLRRLNKQFIPNIDENRLNHVLKNNFYSGSYILEFFDEKKKFEYLIRDEENFEKVSNKIYKHLPINLFKIRDRLGNFIFQFPVNILNVKTKVASDSWDSIDFNIDWHPLIKDNCPDCILEVNSILDNNYIGNAFEKYNKNDSQMVFTGNVDSAVNVIIWRKDPKLVLYSNSGYYIKNFGLFTFIDVQKKRYFINNGEKEVISLKSNDYSSIIQKQEYYQYIENSIGINEKKRARKNIIIQTIYSRTWKVSGIVRFKKVN